MTAITESVHDTSKLLAPVARQFPKVLEEHGPQRVEPYFWLRERENPEVIEYLKQENEYLTGALARTAELQVKLYEEMVGRIKKDDDSVPFKLGPYFYYSRFVAGGEYAVHCRKKGSLIAREEVIRNENELARGHEFFSLGMWDIDSAHRIVAFAVDTEGRGFNTIRFKNLETGKFLPDTLSNVTANLVWAEDGESTFEHEELLRFFLPP